MGGRQSSVAEDRPRSNSVDTASAPQGGHDDQARNPSRSVMTAAEFLQEPGNTHMERKRSVQENGKLKRYQTIRNARIIGSSSDSNGSEDDAGPSTLHQHPMRLRSHGGLSLNHARTGRLRGAEDMTCPICHKTVPSDEADVHLVMCLTRPKITYNDDVLTEDKGECSICLEEMLTGAVIARLPCLCIYHKQCIDEWFKRKNCCPEHPGDD
ncbi:hypothetical protein V3C99_003559 [Haemonchus contortus]